MRKEGDARSLRQTVEEGTALLGQTEEDGGKSDDVA